MSLSLAEFFSWMDRFEEKIPLEAIESKIRGLDIDVDQVREYVRFSGERYQRNMLHSGAMAHALILCWRNGQRSPIHDHRGSSCGVRVLQGVATETLFARSANGLVYPVATSELPDGSVTGSHDDEMHQLSNLQPGDADLVTLHVYSPPLMVMGTYSLTDDAVEDFVDPIFEFAAGSGI